LQRRVPSGAGGAACPGGPGCGIWLGIWLVMAGAFLFLFPLGRRKGMKRKSGDE
jgi:hypothetical protein